jgi:hypothetical protein
MWTQKRIITSFWNFNEIPRSHYATVKAEGYTTLPIANDLGGVQAAAALGIRVIYASEFFDVTSIDIPSRRASLDEIILALQAAGNVSGIFIGDEPISTDFRNIKRMFDFMKQSLPEALPYVNLLPMHATEAQLGVDYSSINQSDSVYSFADNWFGVSSRRRQIVSYISYVQSFINTCSPLVLSWDLYPFVQTERDDFILNLAIISYLARKNGIPFFNTIQASADDASWQMPDEAQLRWQVYQSIAYGCRGIIYYTYWGTAATGSLYRSGQKTATVDVVAQINKELSSISTPIMNYPLIGTYHTGDLPIGGVRLPDDINLVQIHSSGSTTIGFFGARGIAQAIMIANNSYYEACWVTITTEKHLLEIELDGDWKSLSSLPGERVLIKLEAGSGRLFPLIDYRWDWAGMLPEKPVFSPNWKQEATNLFSPNWSPRGLLIMHWDFYTPPTSSFEDSVKEGFSHGAMTPDQVVDADSVGLLSIVKYLATRDVLQTPESRSLFQEKIEGLKKVPGLDGYLLFDEPILNSFAELKEISDIIQQRDPSRLRYINLLPIAAPREQYGLPAVMSQQVVDLLPLCPTDLQNMPAWATQMALDYMEYIKQFVSIVQPQLLCYDHYYLTKGNVNHGWFLNLELIKIISKHHSIPFMVVFQAGSDTFYWETMTEGALRQQFYSILAYGGIGGSYYTYWGAIQWKSLYQDGNPIKLMDSVKVLNHELLAASWFLNAVCVGTYNTDPFPIGTRPMPPNQIVEIIGSAQFCVGIFQNFEGKDGFILSDREWNGQNKWLTIKTTGRRLYKWTRSGTWERVSKDPGGVSTLFWLAGDGAFFKID